jgi:hypothetical protein
MLDPSDPGHVDDELSHEDARFRDEIQAYANLSADT